MLPFFVPPTLTVARVALHQLCQTQNQILDIAANLVEFRFGSFIQNLNPKPASLIFDYESESLGPMYGLIR